MSDLTVEPSRKFHGAEKQYLIHNGKHIFFRVIQFQTAYVLMTATASEDDSSFMLFPSMQAINEISKQVFLHRGLPFSEKKDRFGRNFLEVEFDGRLEEEVVKPDGTRGLEETVCEIVDVYTEAFSATQPRNELISLYRTLADDLDGDDFYLSDGVFLTPAGNLIER